MNQKASVRRTPIKRPCAAIAPCTRVLGFPAPATCGPWAERARNGRSDQGHACDASRPGSRLRRSQHVPNHEVVAARRHRHVGDRLSRLWRRSDPVAELSSTATTPIDGAGEPARQRRSDSPARSTRPTGDAPCGTAPYTGEFKKITAVDAKTVEFQLCTPDVAFLPKVAFSAFGIQDSDYLDKHAADKSYLEHAERHRATSSRPGSKGHRIVFEANPNYWGTKALTPNLEFRWSDQAAQRWLELQAGTVDGIDNPGTDDIDDDQGRHQPSSSTRARASTPCTSA